MQNDDYFVCNIYHENNLIFVSERSLKYFSNDATMS